jgi:hypothetical protein
MATIVQHFQSMTDLISAAQVDNANQDYAGVLEKVNGIRVDLDALFSHFTGLRAVTGENSLPT